LCSPVEFKQLLTIDSTSLDKLDELLGSGLVFAVKHRIHWLLNIKLQHRVNINLCDEVTSEEGMSVCIVMLSLYYVGRISIVDEGYLE